MGGLERTLRMNVYRRSLSETSQPWATRLRFQQRLPQRLQQRLLLPKPHHHHQRRSLSSSSTGTGRSQGSTTTSLTMARTTTAQWSDTLIQGVKFPDAWLSLNVACAPPWSVRAL